jgi:glycine betaine/proline transport system substrate-binding protein
MAKVSRKLLAAILALAVGALAAGCGSSEQPKELKLGNIGWDENEAVSNLTKVLLEDELGYENVELRTLDVGPLYEGVGNGDLHAFQDVWLPAHRDYVAGVEDNTELLGSWFQGTTKFGIAVPSYMNIASLEELNDTNADMILGIEQGAVSMTKIPTEVIPTYGLEQDLVEAPTEGMLSEVERLYNGREEFAFIAWSPHWMNQRYDITYLDDPKDAFEEVDNTVDLSTIVNADLKEDEPVAYAFMAALTLDEEQINAMEDEINTASAPEPGVRNWLENNRDVVQPWIDAANNAYGS